MIDLGEKILNQIKEKGVKPIPKWYFILRKITVWSMILFSLCAESIAVGIIFYHTSHLDHGLMSHNSKSLLKMFILVFPLFWIVVTLIVTIVAVLKLRQVPKGHRLHPFQILGFYLLLITIIGGIGHYLGVAAHTDNYFSHHIPNYESWEKKKILVWNQPEIGLLAGAIGQELTNTSFNLTDMAGEKWIINHESAKWRGNLSQRSGIIIKIIGKVNGNKMNAEEIRPWKSKRMNNHNTNNDCSTHGKNTLDCIRQKHP